MSDKSTKVKKNHHRKKPAISSSLTAYVVGCSPSLVRKVRKGIRSADSKRGQQIEVADMLLQEWTGKMITEVRKLVAFD